MQKMRLTAEIEQFSREGGRGEGAFAPRTRQTPIPPSTALPRMKKTSHNLHLEAATITRAQQPISSCITILGDHATLNTNLLSFLEILQMQWVNKEWQGNARIFLPQLKSLSFQEKGALTNFTGKLNIVTILPSVFRSLSTHLRTVDLRNTEAMGGSNIENFIHRILESCPNTTSIDMSDCDASDTLWVIAALAYKAFYKLRKQLYIDDIEGMEESERDTIGDPLVEQWSPAAFLRVLQMEACHEWDDLTEDNPRLSLQKILDICQGQGVPVVRIDPNIEPGSPWPDLSADTILTKAV